MIKITKLEIRHQAKRVLLANAVVFFFAGLCLGFIVWHTPHAPLPSGLWIRFTADRQGALRVAEIRNTQSSLAVSNLAIATYGFGSSNRSTITAIIPKDQIFR